MWFLTALTSLWAPQSVRPKKGIGPFIFFNCTQNSHSRWRVWKGKVSGTGWNWKHTWMNKVVLPASIFPFSKPHTYHRLGAVLVSSCPGPPALWCPHTSTVLPAGTALLCIPHQCHTMGCRRAGSAGRHNVQPRILRGLEEKRRKSLMFQGHLCLIQSFAYFYQAWRKKGFISRNFKYQPKTEILHALSPKWISSVVFFCRYSFLKTTWNSTHFSAIIKGRWRSSITCWESSGP